jgi:3-hydroxy-9,10-secoandrosta-1,3,5(10)-triene-9,17-dione monooxygenase
MSPPQAVFQRPDQAQGGTAVIGAAYGAQARARGKSYLAAVDRILPGIAKRRAETESANRMTDATVADLLEAGVFRALTPLQWGGLEVDPVSYYEAVIRLASACPSTGWVGGILTVHSWQVALMDARFQAEFFKDTPDARASSAYAPTGTVVRADGGFHLSGRWHFSSGVDISDWAIVGGVIEDGDEGQPEFRSFAVPKTSFVVDHDSWSVAGMKGTGSKSIAMDKAFVPDYRTHRLIDEGRDTNPGYSVNDRPLYRFGRLGIFWTAICCCAIGAATGGLDAFVADTKTRKNRLGTGTSVADNPFLLVRLANALTDVGNVHRRLHATWDEIFECTCRGEMPSRLLRTRARFEAADANAVSFEAFSEVYAVAGGSAASAKNPMQHFLRDLMTMRNHGTAAREQLATIYMQSLLDMPAPPFDAASHHALLVHG